MTSPETTQTLPAEQFSILNDAWERRMLMEHTNELIERARTSDIQTLVFLDRAARPLAWLTEAMWRAHPETGPLPSFTHLNVGHEKNLRDKYMYNRGASVNADGTHGFIGNCDTPENVAIFIRRVRDDRATRQLLKRELGAKGRSDFTGKRVLIVDDIEFEGVSRIFTETILDAVYRPESIAYFEFGTEYRLPHGLVDGPDPSSFLSHETEDPEVAALAIATRKELGRLAVSKPQRNFRRI